MTLKSDAKLGEKLICRFKIDMRNLTKFDPSTWKWQWRVMQNLDRNWLVVSKIDIRNLTSFEQARRSLKKWPVNGLLLSKVYIVPGKKKYSGVIFHDTEEDAKFGEELTCCFKIDIMTFTNFDRLLRSFHFNGLLLNKVYIIWAKRVQRR